MRGRAASVLVTALAALCALAIAGQLRRMLEPAEPWPGIVVAIAAVLAVAWLVRLAPAGLPRISAAAVALLAAVLAVVGLRTGRWPLQEDVGGPDGYLGSAGYLRESGLALGEIARAWVQVLYPAEAAAEPDAVAVMRLVGLLLAVAAAIALIAYRSPVPAILAVATATAVASLFLGLEPVWAYGVGLAALGIALLALVGGEGRGRAPVAALWSGGLLGVAALLALAGPLAVGSGAWAWQDWTIEEPDPVTVGFVWDQSLQSLDFAGEEVTVLEVEGRDIGYLRVGVLEGFDGARWRSAGVAARAVDGPDFPLPESALPQAARIGERAVRDVEIRNVALQTEELPLPGGTIAVRGLEDAARPVTVTQEGVVRLRSPLPVGARYAAETVTVPITPELLDRDVLGAPTDPAVAIAQELAGDPTVGRNADEDQAAPWSEGADERAEQEQPGPFGQEALDASRPPRSDGLSGAPPPPAALISVAGVALPAFGVPDREAEVERILAGAIAEGGVNAGALAGWRSAYRATRPVVQAAQTPYQAAVLLEDWFQREFEYDETASYASGNPAGPLPTFLLSSARRGHCQYFAGAMAALLRLNGIPARVAVGFTQGEEDGDRRIITNRDAHAWVEVRFPYAGWVAFEPTPTRSLPLSTSSTSPVFPQSAAGVAAGALAGLVGPGDRPGGPNGPNRGGTGAVDGTAAGAGESAGWGRRAAILGLVAAAIAAAGLALWLPKRRRDATAFAIEDPGAGAVALRDVLAGWLADQGAVPGAASAAEVARALQRTYGVDPGRWADALERARYAPPEEAGAALREARRETRVAVNRVRDRLDRRERVRGAVRPRRGPRRRRG